MEETVDLDVIICDVVGVVDEAVEVETEVRVKVGSPRRLLVPEPRAELEGVEQVRTVIFAAAHGLLDRQRKFRGQRVEAQRGARRA